MKSYKWVILFLLVCSCSLISPEQKLLSVFESELELLDTYKNDYLGYMKYQTENFEVKKKESLLAIREINKRFNNLSSTEQMEYQAKWKESFQPLVDEIYNKTRAMVTKQKNELDANSLSKVQELTIKMEILEKSSLRLDLIPQFYISGTKNQTQ